MKITQENGGEKQKQMENLIWKIQTASACCNSYKTNSANISYKKNENIALVLISVCVQFECRSVNVVQKEYKNKV